MTENEFAELDEYERNPYYYPENSGLTIVGTIDWSTEAWQFDYTVVWRDNLTGEFLFAHDSGCSCPRPFEDKSKANLTIASKTEILKVVEDRLKAEREYEKDVDWRDSNIPKDIDLKIANLSEKLFRG